jgi:mRNA-degrading endonuclease RelE of RelBE toxin-antitoxin system
MNFEVIATEPFERKLRKLNKKYKSLQEDLLPIVSTLEVNPTLGTPIGKECFKIRVAISSKGKGTSGGGRLITLVRIVNKKVFLLDLYDKADQENIYDKMLLNLISYLEN